MGGFLYVHNITIRGKTPANNKMAKNNVERASFLSFIFLKFNAIMKNMSGKAIRPITNNPLPKSSSPLSESFKSKTPRIAPPTRLKIIVLKQIFTFFIISFHLTLFPVSVKCAF